MLMNKKELYEQPSVIVFTVQTEGVVCQSTGDTGINNWGDGNDFPITF